MKNRLKRFVAFLIIASLIMPSFNNMGIRAVQAEDASQITADSYPTEWKTLTEVLHGTKEEPVEPVTYKASENFDGTATEHGTFTFEYVDVTQSDIALQAMTKNGSVWNDPSGAAIIDTWKQVATNNIYGAVAWNVATDGLVSIGDVEEKIKVQWQGNLDIMFVQKSADGYQALTEWISYPYDANSVEKTLETVTTYAKAGDVVYSIVRAQDEKALNIQDYVVQVTVTLQAEDADGLRPAEWKTLGEVLGVAAEEPEVPADPVTYKASENFDGAATEHGTFTFEYVDVTQSDIALQTMTKNGSVWNDPSSAAIIETWKQVATNKIYGVVAWNAAVDGIVAIGDVEEKIDVQWQGNLDIMFAQKSADGYQALTGWISYPYDSTSVTKTLETVTTYAKAGDVVYSIVRAQDEKALNIQNYVVQVTVTPTSKDEQSLRPTTWTTLAEVFNPTSVMLMSDDSTSITTDISLDNQITGNPIENGNFTFEYVDATQSELTFEKMTNTDGSTYWAAPSGNAKIYTWKQTPTNQEYVAVAYHVLEDGVVTMGDTDNSVTAAWQYNGQIIYVLGSENGYYGLTEWIDLPYNGGSATTLEKVSTYAKAGDVVYSVTRSMTADPLNLQHYIPQVTFTADVTEEPAQTVTYKASENFDGAATEHGTFTFEYVDVTQSDIALQTMTKNDSQWNDPSNAAQIYTWKQVATNKIYGAVAWNVTTDGLVSIGDVEEKIDVQWQGNLDIMFVQKSADGYQALTEWISYSYDSTSVSKTLETVTTYAKAGDVVYSIVRAQDEKALNIQNYVVQVTVTPQAEDTENLRPTEWKTLGEVLLGIVPEEPVEPVTYKASENFDGTATEHGTFTFEYVDVTQSDIALQTMTKNGSVWNDPSGAAIIDTWKQVATNKIYGVVAWNVTTDGLVSIGDVEEKIDVQWQGNLDIMFVQKSADGYQALTEWISYPYDSTSVTKTLETVTTYAKAGDVVYSIVRAQDEKALNIQNYVVQVTVTPEAEDADSLRPTEWKTLAEVLLGVVPTQSVTYKASENFDGTATEHGTFTFEYVDVTQSDIALQAMTKNGSVWNDPSGAAIIDTWKQVATNNIYGVAAWNASVDGLVSIGDMEEIIDVQWQGNLDIMFVQKSADGYQALTEWISYPYDSTSVSKTLETVTTYAKAGDVVYSIVRAQDEKALNIQNYVVQVTVTPQAEDTDSLRPTEWTTLREVLDIAEVEPPLPDPVEWTNDIGWYVQQWVQPWEGSYFTYEYFDVDKNAFHELEAWNNLGSPAYWQDATGVAAVKPWAMVSTGAKYAATAITAEQDGTMLLTKSNAAVKGGISTGEFMLLQVSKDVDGNEVYHALVDWTEVKAGETMAWNDVTTYVHKGDKVYYLYRSTSRDTATLEITPKVTYMMGAVEDAENGFAYPAEWGTLADVVKPVVHQIPVYTVTVSASTGGTVEYEAASGEAGADLPFKFVPDAGYEIADVIVNGISVGKTTRYTFTEIRRNHELEVIFQKGEDTATAAIIDSSTLEVNRDLFYGVCYCGYEASAWYGRDTAAEIAAADEIGASTLRLWMCSNYMMRDSQTFNTESVAIMKDIIAEAQSKGIQVIGMNNAWFSGSNDYMAVPARNTQEGSSYQKFLANYEETWYQIAKKFPEITIWEIGNEWNNDTFLHPLEYKSSGATFTFSEKADITTDMLYYASKGIHRVNPKALTVLGGLVDLYEQGTGDAENFLEEIYQNIESGSWPSINPDYYFQIAAWHPYNHSGIPTEEWVQHQKDIYQVILDHEGHDKVVFFTEFGYSDHGSLARDPYQKEWVTEALTMMEEEFPFVQSVHWFRMFDEASASSWGGDFETGFGLFTEPDENGDFTIKEKGKAYLELSGGTLSTGAAQ